MAGRPVGIPASKTLTKQNSTPIDFEAPEANRQKLQIDTIQSATAKKRR
jgi:hypothetical protein